MSKLTERMQKYPTSEAVKRLNAEFFGINIFPGMALPRSVKIEKRKGSPLEEKFIALWQSMGGRPLVREWRFDKNRKWRFDFADLVSKVAVEIEGGIWVNGAHTRGKHFISDCEKYNRAAVLGWRVIRLTGEMVTRENLDEIKNLLS